MRIMRLGNFGPAVETANAYGQDAYFLESLPAVTRVRQRLPFRVRWSAVEVSCLRCGDWLERVPFKRAVF